MAGFVIEKRFDEVYQTLIDSSFNLSARDCYGQRRKENT